jgi:hypothetical protein
MKALSNTNGTQLKLVRKRKKSRRTVLRILSDREKRKSGTESKKKLNAKEGVILP